MRATDDNLTLWLMLRDLPERETLSCGQDAYCTPKLPPISQRFRHSFHAHSATRRHEKKTLSSGGRVDHTNAIAMHGRWQLFCEFVNWMAGMNERHSQEPSPMSHGPSGQQT